MKYQQREWVKDNILGTNWEYGLTVTARRLVKLWAYNALPSHKKGDIFFDMQNFNWNRSHARKMSELHDQELEGWWDREVARRIAAKHPVWGITAWFNNADKEVEKPLRWLTHYKNTYPGLGITLMLKTVSKYSKMTNSVYNVHCPKFKYPP
ncbi:MAG: hypothetical protein ABFS16_05325 [Bacteroidota bacterium]